MNESQKPQLKGIFVPLVTTILRPDRLDTDSLNHLIDHVIQGGINGIFIPGTTGEGPSLDYFMRKKMVETACSYTNHRAAVLVGIIDTSISQAAAAAKIAADNGADAVVLTAPYYFSISQNDLFEYTKELAGKICLPICLYNKPDCTKIVFEIETLKKLLPIKNIIGIKDSSTDMFYLKELLKLKKNRPDWSVFMGIEQLLAEAVFEAADGGVTGGANLLPRLFVDLYRAAVEKKTSEIQHLRKIVLDTAEHLYRPDYLTGLKYALSCKKLCSELLALPLGAADPEQKKRIAQYLQGLSYP